jgi:hypothetical protein
MNQFYTQGVNQALTTLGLAKYATGSTGVGMTAPRPGTGLATSDTGSTVTGEKRTALDDPITHPPPMTEYARPGIKG